MPASELTYRAANRLGLAGLAAFGVRVRLHGTEHVPTTGPAVLAGNHVSYLDFLLVEYAARTRGRFVRFLCRGDIWDVHPALARAMDAMGHVPVHREVGAYALLRARDALEAGEVVGAFPEAGLSPSLTVRDLMPGPAALAVTTGAPLLPVVVWGTQRLATVDHVAARRGRLVDVLVGAPLTPSEHETVDALTGRLGTRLQGMLDDVQRRPEHAPGDGTYAWWHPRHLGGHAYDTRAGRRRNPAPASAREPVWRPRGS
ncbi:1-acyl-sn-glycerol-3-phosphate acyltransferase [Nocardioidaceae bacterium]|nr:1-acyl-sn-glycerol-3-phosphate acyltransferase [Nocardioidaceae bacterium]